MSLVGPRPEQGAYVKELSKQIPFYTQRHVVKPGITGWAQVRVGYSGSLEGTAFKLCNDLYYVKHHSISLDIAILLETLRTLVADKQYVEPPSTSLTMLGEGEGRVVVSARLGSRRRLPAPLLCLSQKLLELQVELLDPERLGDVGIDARVGGLALVGVTGLGRQEHDGNLGGAPVRAHPGADLVALDPGHDPVQDRRIRRLAEHELERVVAVRRGHDVIAAMRQALGDQPQDVGVVVGDQHRRQRAFVWGSAGQNVADPTRPLPEAGCRME